MPSRGMGSAFSDLSSTERTKTQGRWENQNIRCGLTLWMCHMSAMPLISSHLINLHRTLIVNHVTRILASVYLFYLLTTLPCPICLALFFTLSVLVFFFFFFTSTRLHHYHYHITSFHYHLTIHLGVLHTSPSPRTLTDTPQLHHLIFPMLFSQPLPVRSFLPARV